MMRPAAESESLHYIGPLPRPPPREFGRRHCLSIKRELYFLKKAAKSLSVVVGVGGS